MAKAVDPNVDSSWQQRAVDRSLSSAKARAVSRSGQILDAAQSLMIETDSIDFTVQDIVDRSGLSLRSFYKHFGGKDELLLALFEELLADFAGDLREEVEVFDDPVDQLCAYVRGFYGRAEHSGDLGGRALGTYHVRMLAVRKDEFSAALGPQIDLLREIVSLGVASGAFRRDLEVDDMTGLITVTLMSASQMAVLDVRLTGRTPPLDAVWAWCASAVGVNGAPTAVSDIAPSTSGRAPTRAASKPRGTKRSASKARSAG